MLLVELECKGDHNYWQILTWSFCTKFVPGNGHLVPPLPFLLTSQLLVLHATSVLQTLKKSLICLHSLLPKFRDQTTRSQSFQRAHQSITQQNKASGSVGSSIGQTGHEGLIDPPSGMRVVMTAIQCSRGSMGQHIHEAFSLHRSSSFHLRSS